MFDFVKARQSSVLGLYENSSFSLPSVVAASMESMRTRQKHHLDTNFIQSCAMKTQTGNFFPLSTGDKAIRAAFFFLLLAVTLSDIDFS